MKLFVPIAIAGIGVCMIIITGGIDLSLGSVYGLAGVISTLVLSKTNLNVFFAIVLGVAAAAMFGLFNGLVIVKINLPPFIATLASMSIARGLCYVITQGYPITGIESDFFFIGQGSIAGIPTAVWCMVVVAIAFSIFLNKTVTGRRIYAVGGNEEATRISGVNTGKIKILVYTLCSALAGFAGIITASKLGIGQPTSGTGFEMDAIAAVAIGGASLSGGSGTVAGTIIGAAIMGILRNALVLLSVDAYWQQLIIGCVILIAVAADQISKKRDRKH
ncbi:MAG: ABC transporter permease [Eubacteriales bacterium]